MTRDEFIRDYCLRSNWEWDSLSKYYVALPCECGAEECQGWAMIRNVSAEIDRHYRYDAPKYGETEKK